MWISYVHFRYWIIRSVLGKFTTAALPHHSLIKLFKGAFGYCTCSTLKRIRPILPPLPSTHVSHIWKCDPLITQRSSSCFPLSLLLYSLLHINTNNMWVWATYIFGSIYILRAVRRCLHMNDIHWHKPYIHTGGYTSANTIYILIYSYIMLRQTCPNTHDADHIYIYLVREVLKYCRFVVQTPRTQTNITHVWLNKQSGSHL